MLNQSLYRISTEMQTLLEEITTNEGEITPEIEEKIALVNSHLTAKTDDVVGWVNSREDLITLANQRISDLTDFINGINKGLEKFDGYVNNCLISLGTNKIEGNLYSITRRKPAQVVTIFDEKLIPMDFVKIPTPPPATVMKAEIATALKAGKLVPGAKLTESTNVSISYKAKKK
jgi:hypothetical protein